MMNALLVLVERYSALKRARFGSETSAAALQGMRVLLRLVGETSNDQMAVDGLWDQRAQPGIAEPGENCCTESIRRVTLVTFCNAVPSSINHDAMDHSALDI